MIDRVLLRAYFQQSLLLWSACALVLFIFGWVRVWVSSLIDMGQFRTIIDQFRDFERFAPVGFDALFNHTGRVGMTFDEPIVILCIVIWAVARGSDVISGELGRGTLEMLLAQPIARSRLLLSHTLVAVFGLLTLVLALWAGMAVGISNTMITETVPPPTLRLPFTTIELPLGMQGSVESFPMHSVVDPWDYASAVFSLFAFGFFLLALATLLSSVDRYRWRTIGAVIGIYIVQLVLFGLGKAAERLEWMLNWTFFSCYRPQQQIAVVVDEGWPAAWRLTGPVADEAFAPGVYPLLLVGAGLACFVLAHLALNRRDLPAPL